MRRIILLSLVLCCGIAAWPADKHYQGDINNDGILDLADLLELAQAINSGAAYDATNDVDHSGVVDRNDLQCLAELIVLEKYVEESGFTVGIGDWNDNGEDYGGVVGAPARHNATDATGYKVAFGDLSYDITSDTVTVPFALTGRENIYACLVNVILPAHFQSSELTLTLPQADKLVTASALSSSDKNISDIDKLRFVLLSTDLSAFDYSDEDAPRLSYANTACSGNVSWSNCQYALCGETAICEYADYTQSYNFEYVLCRSLSIQPDELQLTVGATASLTAAFEPSDVTVNSLLWSSDAPEIATVSNDGQVTALGEGSATISATATDGSGCEALCQLTVVSMSSLTIPQADTEASVSIFSIDGLLQYQGRLSDSHLPPGIYIITDTHTARRLYLR